MSESSSRSRSAGWWCGTIAASLLSVFSVAAILLAVVLRSLGWTYFYLGHHPQLVMAVNFEKITLASNGEKLVDADTIPLIAIAAVFPIAWWIHLALRPLRRPSLARAGFEVISGNAPVKRQPEHD